MPGFTTVQAIYGNAPSKRMPMFLSGLYGGMAISISILVGVVYGILNFMDMAHNIYMVVIQCITLLLIIVFCADMMSVSTVMLFMVAVDALISGIK